MEKHKDLFVVIFYIFGGFFAFFALLFFAVSFPIAVFFLLFGCILLYRGRLIQTNKDPWFLKERPLPKSSLAKIALPKKDETFANKELNTDGISVNSLFLLKYKDANENISERRITIINLSDWGDDVALNSYCHERKAYRTFLSSRIIHLVDLETGEIIDYPIDYLIEKQSKSPLGIVTRVIDEFEPEVLTLIYMGRADGVLRKKEKELIAAYIASKSSNSLDNSILIKEIGRTYCGVNELRKSLKILSAKSINEKKDLIKLAEQIMSVDKTVDPLEIGAMEKIRKELKVPSELLA
ncbi:hypothetical protein [Leptospira koniambonensis]|uniref:hypothetical protein n=1 Tax=Leptospira koniambonensis TaxID=2484950 RepID=UPI003EB77E8B